MHTHAIAPFRSLIQTRAGLVFEDYAEQKLQQALQQRAATIGMQADDQFLQRLQSDTDEFQQLINALTVNETYFFRESDQIQLLTECLIPRLINQLHRKSRPLHILSAGCASGEEPYSIAIALTDVYGANTSSLFRISGVDIDSAVLEKARSARYSEFSFRGVSAENRQRFFSNEASDNRLIDNIKNQVDFAICNLVTALQPPMNQRWDIIFFRNVSFYFDAATRKNVLKKLQQWLTPNGYLIVGSSEIMANDLGILSLVQEKGQFYFSNHPKAVHTPVPPVIAEAIKPSQNTCPPAVALGNTIEQATIMAWTREKNYTKAEQALELRLSRQPTDPWNLLLTAFIYLERKEFKAAETAALQVLNHCDWDADAMLVLGWIAKWRNQHEEAAVWFKKTVYAHHTCWPAHYYLGEMYQILQQTDLAIRCYRTVRALLSQTPLAETGLRYIPHDLEPGKIDFLCTHKLMKLGTSLTLLQPITLTEHLAP